MAFGARKILARLGMAGAVAAAVSAGTIVNVAAASGGHFTTPAPGTKVTGNLKSGTDMTFNGTINGVPITVSCKTFTGSGKIPKSGLSISIAPPTISGCTDSLGGTDTLKTNQANGKWMVKEILGSKGDQIDLAIPKAGATFTSSIVSGCVVTAAPSATANVKGSYNNVNTATVKNAKIPVKGSGCSASAATTSATVVFTPNVEAAS